MKASTTYSTHAVVHVVKMREDTAGHSGSPEANAKEIASTRRVEMPIAAAIGRFCTTARTFSANVVR